MINPSSKVALKTLGVAFRDYLPNAPRPSCLKFCPAGEATWRNMLKLKTAKCESLCGEFICQHCDRWVTVYDPNAPKQELTPQ